ncbi:unnamed protein product [Urochloa decumbens]|uniref:DUF4220 domain-containing protein n=1 Tax=Urochloa decumbens TaxID=240449 RepID=A0ABC8WJQ9_9POAL
METAYVFVLLGVFFLCCQLILVRVARFCRCSSHWLFLRVAEGANYLPNFLGSVALGAMPKEHSVALWILYLIVLNNSLVTHDLENKVLYLYTLCNIGFFIFRALMTAIHAGLGRVAYASIITMACASASCQIIGAKERSDSTGYSEEIARHMREEHVDQGEADWDSSTLRGYRYKVELDSEKTLDQIFEHDDDRKDLCLSFALFQLLFCTYRGIQCYDKEAARHPKTRSLVLEGLLQQQADDDGYARGFRVVEAELGFLYDHIHGGYVLCSRAARYCYLSLVFVTAIVMYVAGAVIYCRSEWDADHHSYQFLAPLLLHGFFDMLKIILYCGSDRQVVSYMCNPNAWHHVCFHHWFIRPIHSVVNKLDHGWNLYWQDLLGQYSLLAPVNPAACSLSFLSWQTTSLFSHSEEESAPETLPPCLKVSIARAIKNLTEPGDMLPPSLQQAQNFPGVEGRQKIETILKWHIATCYCEMHLENHGGQLLQDVGRSERYQVAKLLSRYCAYLVAFRPELLPCRDSSTTRRTFKGVLDDVTSLVRVRDDNGLPLSLGETLRKLDDRMIDDTVSPGKTAMLSDGLRLGHHLINDIQEHEQVWANLAKIWVKLILWVAPQDATCAKNHAKYLARGGEFVTHLWAMLSHAGILEQSSWPSCISSGGQVTPWIYPTDDDNTAS